MKKPNKDISSEKSRKDLPGYPAYPSKDDIYNKDKEESDVDPENPSMKKEKIVYRDFDDLNEKDFFSSESGDDLDVPGSELDDDMEDIGSEDEENNFYSLGGDKD